LREELPHLERLVAAARKLLDEEKSNASSSPCDTCPKNGDCQETCQAVERKLERPYRGKLHNESTIDFDWALLGARNTPHDTEDGDDENSNVKGDRSVLRNIKKVQTLSILEQYHEYWDTFPKKQREVLALHYGEGKSVTEIARVLGKSKSNVSELLKKARTSKKLHDLERRREYFELVRNSQD